MKSVLCALFLLTFVTNLTPLWALGSAQRYIASGKFLCGKRTSAGNETSVKLLDKNIGRDTTMGKQKTDSDGSFRIDGTSSGITKIDLELHIYTRCNDGILSLCPRRWRLKLPTAYIDDTHGYDIGTINLESKIVDGEDRDCFH